MSFNHLNDHTDEHAQQSSAPSISPQAIIHETAWVDTPCQIGAGSAVMHFSHIMAHAMIGNGCHIAQHVTIYEGVLLGNQVKVMENARLNSGVIMEDGATCGPSVSICGLSQLRANKANIARIAPTLIRKAARLGPNSTIASGVTVGQHAFIEANTVVDKTVGDYAIVSGNPLKIIGYRCQCGATLPIKPKALSQHNTIRCEQCDDQYHTVAHQGKQTLVASNPKPASQLFTHKTA